MKPGAVDYITKPLELEELLLIDRIVGHRRPLRENDTVWQKLRELDEIGELSPSVQVKTPPFPTGGRE